MVPVGGVRDATRPAVPLTAFDRYSANKKDKDRIEGKCRRCCLGYRIDYMYSLPR